MYWILRALAAFLGRLSETTIDRIASGLAWFVFDLTKLRRRVIMRNLAIAFPDMPEAERERIGRESVRHFALTVMEFLRSGQVDIAANVEFKNREHIDAALAKRQGVYILCFHLGNWEAMGGAVSRCIVPSYVFVKKVGSDSVDRFVSEWRRKNGFLIAVRRKKGDGFRIIREVLQRGEGVGFVIDQARPGEPKLPFFGKPAKTNTSFAAIWRRLPAPIVPSFITRSGVGRHVIEFLPEVNLTVTDDAEADILRHSSEFNAVVEECIRRKPEQYFWMHNRWK